MRTLITLLAVLWAGSAVAQVETADTITVTGEGSVAAAPDQATLQTGVTARADEAADAVSEVATALDEVLAQITAAGVDRSNVQTSNLRLSPVYEERQPNGGTPEIVGFESASDLAVTTGDLDGLGDLLDAVLSAGATQFGGLSFGLEDPTEAMDEARRKAVSDAMRKAGLYAEAAGVALGPVRTITETQGGGAPRPMRAFDMAEARTMPVAEGEIAVTASVTMVFTLEQP